MARTYYKKLEFPIAGLNKATSISHGPAYNTPYANNFWPLQWAGGGRARGGTRLGVADFQDVGGQPCYWTNVAWEDSNTNYRGIAVATKSGVFVSTGGAFTEAITDSAASDFCSCAVFNNDLYFARYSEGPLVRTLTSPGSGAGTAMGTLWSEGAVSGDGGTPPQNCGLVAVHGNRLVFAGDEENPQVIYFSRAGYPKDWDYAQTDSAAAWATSGGESGKIGQPITSLITHTQNCLIVGCTDSMYVVRGNPASGGSIEMLATNIGPLTPSSWCKTTNGWTFFMTRDGLYKIPPGCPGAAPEPVSRRNLPEELVAIDPGVTGTYVSIAYDPRWIGIHIYVNQPADVNTYYFYDLTNEGFWPMTFADEMRLAATHPVAATTTDSALIAFDESGDGYQFTTDSSENISSYCTYGPIQLAPQGMEGIINEVDAVLAENSSAVSWKLYVGNSAAEAYQLLINDHASFTGENWSVGTTDRPGSSTAGTRLLQYLQNPLVAGHVAYLKIYASGTSARISVEEINLTTVEAGRRAVL